MAKITIQDVAEKAGVSVATIDRVLNKRPGVRAHTVEKVETAIRELNYQPDRIAARLARSRDYRFLFILPNSTSEFMAAIAAEVDAMAQRMLGERVTILTRKVDVFDGPLLAATLDQIGEDVDGVAVVALDHPSPTQDDCPLPRLHVAITANCRA
jgi:LacI family transcriptional regulator